MEFIRPAAMRLLMKCSGTDCQNFIKKHKFTAVAKTPFGTKGKMTHWYDRAEVQPKIDAYLAAKKPQVIPSVPVVVGGENAKLVGIRLAIIDMSGDVKTALTDLSERMTKQNQTLFHEVEKIANRLDAVCKEIGAKA